MLGSVLMVLLKYYSTSCWQSIPIKYWSIAQLYKVPAGTDPNLE